MMTTPLVFRVSGPLGWLTPRVLLIYGPFARKGSYLEEVKGCAINPLPSSICPSAWAYAYIMSDKIINFIASKTHACVYVKTTPKQVGLKVTYPSISSIFTYSVGASCWMLMTGSFSYNTLFSNTCGGFISMEIKLRFMYRLTAASLPEGIFSTGRPFLWLVIMKDLPLGNIK